MLVEAMVTKVKLVAIDHKDLDLDDRIFRRRGIKQLPLNGLI
jgi:hypothetical protein